MTDATSKFAVRVKALAIAFVLIGLIACSGSREPASSNNEPFRVALIANGPLTDSGFNQAQKESLDEAKRLLGDRVEVQSIGDVPETGDAERILRRLIAERSNLLIAASFGYQDTSVKLATEFPQLRFLQAWGFKPAANLGTYSAKMYEAWYVMGIVAGKMTKTGKLGIVAAHPIPPMRWQINAYVLGARSVNPKVTASVAFINHWFDPGLATEATETLINQGADVVTGVLDNSVAVARTAERRSVMLIGHNTDLSSFAPNSILVGTKWQWGKLYADAISKMLDGTWNGSSGDLNGGFKEGYVGITDFSARVPADVRRAAEEAVAKIASGELVIYRGPLKDNTGRTVVAAGSDLTHDQIMGIDWFVEGVR